MPVNGGLDVEEFDGKIFNINAPMSLPLPDRPTGKQARVEFEDKLDKLFAKIAKIYEAAFEHAMAFSNMTRNVRTCLSMDTGVYMPNITGTHMAPTTATCLSRPSSARCRCTESPPARTTRTPVVRWPSRLQQLPHSPRRRSVTRRSRLLLSSLGHPD